MFGYVPQIFVRHSNVKLLGFWLRLLEMVLQPEQLLSASLSMRVLALTCISYNCWYLAAVFGTMGAS